MMSPLLLSVWLVGLAAPQLAFAAPTITITATNTPAADREALAPVFGKRFILKHCDNMDGVMKTAGLNEYIRRVLADMITTSMMLSEDNGEYKLTSHVGLKINNGTLQVLTSTVKFRIGQEIEVLNVDGEISKAVITQEGNTLTEVRSGNNPGTTIRTFTPGEVKTIVKIKDSTNNCIYTPE